jgi:hypothetical protein
MITNEDILKESNEEERRTSESRMRGKSRVRFDEVEAEKGKGGRMPSNKITFLINVVRQAAF